MANSMFTSLLSVHKLAKMCKCISAVMHSIHKSSACLIPIYSWTCVALNMFDHQSSGKTEAIYSSTQLKQEPNVTVSVNVKSTNSQRLLQSVSSLSLYINSITAITIL